FVHAPDKMVLNLGRFVDRAPYLNKYDWMKIYWRSTATRAEDYLTAPHYFFRYDRGVTNVRPRSFLGRLLFGKLVTTNELLRLAERFEWLLGPTASTVTLDVFVPFSRLPDLFDWYAREIGHYPLWIVPYRRVRDYEWIAGDFYAGLTDDLFIDVAIYGLR